MRNKKQLFEALKPSEIRPYMGLDRQLANQRIENVWDNLKKIANYKNKSGDRLYFTLDDVKNDSDDKHILECEPIITKFLGYRGYEVVNFYEGKVKKFNDKNIINIGKVLTFLGKRDKEALDLLKKYAGEKSLLSIGDDYLIVISKHPYDIVGMSTDRNWTSCMNIRDDKVSQYKKYLPLDITQGTIVSYLIKRHDLNIKRPIARILIKPYYSIDKRTDILYGVEYDSFTKYGLHNKNYPKTLLRIFDYCQKGKTGVFVQDSKLYDSNNAVPIVNDVYYQRKIDKLSKQTKKLHGKNLTPEKLFTIAPWLAEASFSNAVFEVQPKNDDDDDLTITWLEGEWYDGDWIEGTFFGGIWHDGTWHNGTFGESRWEKGTWLNGTFSYNSTWYNGTWHNGTFSDSRWHNGTWLNGKFIMGLWHDGIWKNGLFKKSNWVDGDWFNGTFEDSKWRDGKWYQGEWHEGKIFDPEIKTLVKSYYPPR